MLRKLGKRFSPGSFEKEEDRQTAQILIVIIIGAFLTCLFTVLGGLYWQDTSVVQIGALGIAMLAVTLGLYAYRHLGVAIFFIGLGILAVVTLGAVTGGGIHDISIIAYPAVILVASMITNKLGIILLTSLSTVSIGWLVYGETTGLFIPYPPLRASLPDFLITASILVGAALIMNLQTGNMRKNLKKAQEEIAQRKDMEEQLRYLGTHDILTGLYNRLFFDGELSRLENSDLYPISIIVADLDNLKITNDTRGHNVGDELLKRASEALHLSFRTGDVLARIGGDEFAVLLPSTDEHSLEAILSRIQTRIDAVNSAHSNVHVQLSFGAATAKKGHLTKSLIDADQRMYDVKSARKARGSNASAG